MSKNKTINLEPVLSLNQIIEKKKEIMSGHKSYKLKVTQYDMEEKALGWGHQEIWAVLLIG